MPSDPVSVSPSRLLTLAGYVSFVLIGWKALLLPSLIRSIEHEFHKTDAAFAVLYLLAALVYAVGAFGGGVLTERIGRRAVLLSALLLCGLGIFGQAVAPTWIIFVLALAPSGWGSGVIDGGVNALFLDLYREARGGALNFLHVFFGVGSFVAPFAIGLLVTAGMSWRWVYAMSGLPFLLLSPLFAVVQMPSGRHDRAAARSPDVELAQAERSLLPFVGLALGIGFYVAAEIGVSSWLVRFLSGASLATATGVLSIFWGGLTLGRLLSGWIAERYSYYAFTLTCIALSSLALAGAVLTPWLPLVAVLFGLTGLFYAPIFPMIMALGGNIYPHRLATLSGGLTTAAVLGGVVYPPLMGFMEARIGLSGGMLGAALLGIPMAISIVVVRSKSGPGGSAAIDSRDRYAAS